MAYNRDKYLRAKARGKPAAWQHKFKYGLTELAFARLLVEQDGACAICRKPFERTPQVDHDHGCCPGERSCGRCVRGLLCGRCNTRLIGVEDAEWLAQAQEYVRTRRVEPAPTLQIA